jgi:hypothetical protein
VQSTAPLDKRSPPYNMTPMRNVKNVSLHDFKDMVAIIVSFAAEGRDSNEMKRAARYVNDLRDQCVYAFEDMEHDDALLVMESMRLFLGSEMDRLRRAAGNVAVTMHFADGEVSGNLCEGEPRVVGTMCWDMHLDEMADDNACEAEHSAEAAN